ncbi:hypothetical protein MalM25_13890 [Planctomycetes bacterium MalM25]|nr:hypothetical protein MalM25_13890 [Planctomycetes bacterium MalM25]
MLVLTRKPQEKIRIGDNITITVIKTKGQGVRLGIEAPRDVPVLRGELVASHDSFAEAEEPTQQEDSTGVEVEESVVSFTRTKRSRVGTVLPNLLGEAGPLREMMAGRSSTNV